MSATRTPVRNSLDTASTANLSVARRDTDAAFKEFQQMLATCCDGSFGSTLL